MSQNRLYVIARKSAAENIATLLDPLFEEQGFSTALFEDKDNTDNWCWSVYVDTESQSTVQNTIKERLNQANVDAQIQVEDLDDRDWVSETLRDLAPVRAGRFFIHGSHDSDKVRVSDKAVQIDAGLAFGTGHHGTTAGCLDMLERVLRRRRPQKGMDVGTGTGVLAIALAKSCHIPVLATDIDPVSVQVTRQNCSINGVSSEIQTATAAGFQHPAFGQWGQADIVFANILARPLEKLSHPMFPHVARGGDVILSGLLPHQQSRIVNAYRRQGLLLEHAHIRDGWLTLLMNRP